MYGKVNKPSWYLTTRKQIYCTYFSVCEKNATFTKGGQLVRFSPLSHT